MKPDTKLLFELLKTFFIGIIEGITEWLPVSSTGHMLLFDSFLTLDASEEFKEVFFVVIQFGAILAVVCCFFSKMLPLRLGNTPKIQKDVLSVWGKVIVAVIPSAVCGLFLDDYLEEHFGNAFSVSVMLIAYGMVFILVENMRKNTPPSVLTANEISVKDAFIIGLFQVLSLIPGTSRSGATIIGAMLIGVKRTASCEFTFFLAVPTMLGASILKLAKSGLAFSGTEYIMLLVGSLTAFAVSLVAVRFLMNFSSKHSFTGFGIYRIILGITVIFAEIIK